MAFGHCPPSDNSIARHSCQLGLTLVGLLHAAATRFPETRTESTIECRTRSLPLNDKFDFDIALMASRCFGAISPSVICLFAPRRALMICRALLSTTASCLFRITLGPVRQTAAWRSHAASYNPLDLGLSGEGDYCTEAFVL